jgi:hypothetical protein
LGVLAQSDAEQLKRFGQMKFGCVSESVTARKLYIAFGYGLRLLVVLSGSRESDFLAI